MGLRPEKMMDTDLKPRNLQTGATWKFPPTLLMAAGNDEGEILELINNTQAAMQTKVSGLHGSAAPFVFRLFLLQTPARLRHQVDIDHALDQRIKNIKSEAL